MKLVVKTIVVRNLFSYEYDGSNPSPSTNIRGNGGIGRRARFRSVCWWQHAGSSPVSRTIKELKISSFLIMFWRLQRLRPPARLLFYCFYKSPYKTFGGREFRWFWGIINFFYLILTHLWWHTGKENVLIIIELFCFTIFTDTVQQK